MSNDQRELLTKWRDFLAKSSMVYPHASVEAITAALARIDELEAEIKRLRAGRAA